MERFFLFQPLIEAVVEQLEELSSLLKSAGLMAIQEAMRTPIHIQQLDPAGLELVGEPSILLVNDLSWEGHLIEGPWLTHQQGRYYLFYAGNDFSTPDYGIGVAVSESLLGPYRKQGEPLLRSSMEWIGPGHPSVAADAAGHPHLFFHAFRRGDLG
jgi:beta-xylosidase